MWLRPLFFKRHLLPKEMPEAIALLEQAEIKLKHRHCEERRDEAIRLFPCGSGLLRRTCHRAGEAGPVGSQ
jgi:hypothetical protein